MFYVYAALMGFTLSSIFLVYSISDIGVALVLCAAFFFVLTMFSLTTKFDMLLKAGPILMVGLVVLIIPRSCSCSFRAARPGCVSSAPSA